jgi:hypothetical protein
MRVMWMLVHMSSRRFFYAVSVRIGLFEGVKGFCGQVATIVAGELFLALKLV